MALTQRIRVVFTQVVPKRRSTLWGPAEWSFRATVGGTAVGDPAAVFAAEGRTPVDLPDDAWATIVDVNGLDRVEVEFAGTARRDEETHDLGRVTWRMRFPFSERDQVLSNLNFTVTVHVELEVGGAFGTHDANEVFASRQVGGQTIFTTVSGKRFAPRLEFCEVRPTPGDAGMPPRPVQPGGTAGPTRNGRGHRRVLPGDPVNLISNPAVIPILPAAEADDAHAACIEYTYYRPSTLAFALDDARLVWTQRSLADGGAVTFVGPAQGLKIHVNGSHEGEVLLECRMEGALLATYRALVHPMRDIVCRFNILNGPPGAIPRSTPDNVLDHMKIANIFLRQIGLQLTLDTDATTTDGAVATAIDGIFRIAVGAGTTAAVAGDQPRCTRLNYRAGVMNFAYIHSDNTAGGLGMASDIPANALAPTIVDSGTPSTSWKQPSGIAPDRAARAIRMRMFRAFLRKGHPDLRAMYVTDLNGNPAAAADQLTYAGTITHELGHILGLRHRRGAGHDNLSHPWDENVMHGTNPSTIAQDLDIIQARAVLGSPAVT